jgi:hypothetical protein
MELRERPENNNERANLSSVSQLSRRFEQAPTSMNIEQTSIYRGRNLGDNSDNSLGFQGLWVQGLLTRHLHRYLLTQMYMSQPIYCP